MTGKRIVIFSVVVALTWIGFTYNSGTHEPKSDEDSSVESGRGVTTVQSFVKDDQQRSPASIPSTTNNVSSSVMQIPSVVRGGANAQNSLGQKLPVSEEMTRILGSLNESFFSNQVAKQESHDKLKNFITAQDRQFLNDLENLLEQSIEKVPNQSLAYLAKAYAYYGSDQPAMLGLLASIRFPTENEVTEGRRTNQEILSEVQESYLSTLAQQPASRIAEQKTQIVEALDKIIRTTPSAQIAFAAGSSLRLISPQTYLEKLEEYVENRRDDRINVFDDARMRAMLPNHYK